MQLFYLSYMYTQTEAKALPQWSKSLQWYLFSFRLLHALASCVLNEQTVFTDQILQRVLN